MRSKKDAGIYTAEMGAPPQDIDGGSAPPPKRQPIASKSKVRVAPKPDESQRHYKGFANSSKAK